MRSLILTVIFGFIISAGTSHAQVNVNLGSQPQWGPAGYNYVEYYYLPDIETYYYVPKKQFVYLNNGRWVFSTSLPSRYSGYDLYNGYKVVLNMPRPYLSYTSHKIKYGKYKGLKGKQKTLKSRPPGHSKQQPNSSSGKNIHSNLQNGNNIKASSPHKEKRGGIAKGANGKGKH